jgi:carbon storage regulator CsrA
MLVLSRQKNETIEIGENIVLTITSISRNRVSIGIEAPKDIRVVRGELKDKPCNYNQQTVSSSSLIASSTVQPEAKKLG